MARPYSHTPQPTSFPKWNASATAEWKTPQMTTVLKIMQVPVTLNAVRLDVTGQDQITAVTAYTTTTS